MEKSRSAAADVVGVQREADHCSRQRGPDSRQCQCPVSGAQSELSMDCSGSRLCKNVDFSLEFDVSWPNLRMEVTAYFAITEIIVSNPIILIIRFMLYARTCKLISVRTFGSVFIRK